MIDAAATRPTTTDPTAANPFETAAFSDGAGASDGGEEIDDGEDAGTEVGGDGGELTTEDEGEGAAAGGDMDEEGEGVAVFGGAAANSGDDAGDCATAEKTNIATSRRSRVEENAILTG